MARRILLVEDDSVISMAIRDRLHNEGYDVNTAADGNEGFAKASKEKWDLVILDIMLPGMDGLQLCRDIRAKGISIPVLMLTAKNQTIDKVIGLKMGADDYLAKPFEMIELMARVEALIRRSRHDGDEPESYTIGKYTLHLRQQELHHAGGSIPLTAFEYKLLRFFCEHRGEIVDRDEILNAVWGYDSIPFTRTIDTHIALLRKKLGDSRKRELIVTIRGRGYKLAE